MVIIQDILISDDVFTSHFACDIPSCSGACCWEGDYGAPLEDVEKVQIANIKVSLFDILPTDQVEVIKQKGFHEYYKEPKLDGTPLMPDRSCAFMIRSHKGIAKCAFEILFEQGVISFKKPISCELYPLRIIENMELRYFAINYDQWHICLEGRKLGKKNKMPVFRFVKEAIIRKYGLEFYDEMEAYYNYRIIK